MKPTKKVEERIKSSMQKFKKVLAVAKDKDITESDTVAIVNDMLAETFGYEKYVEITSELMIRGTYCDLAIKLDESFEKGMLIECKRIGTDLKEEHMRQAVNYGVNKGITWVMLTNGAEWRLYKLRFEQPISWDMILKFNLLEIDTKSESDLEKLFCICKEGVLKNSREDLFEKVQCFNRYVVGQMLLQEPFLNLMRKELRKMSDGIMIEEAEIEKMVRNSILRRDIVDEEMPEVQSAVQKVCKFYKQTVKHAVKRDEPKKEVAEEKKPEMSVTERLLAESESMVADGKSPDAAAGGAENGNL